MFLNLLNLTDNRMLDLWQCESALRLTAGHCMFLTVLIINISITVRWVRERGNANRNLNVALVLHGEFPFVVHLAEWNLEIWFWKELWQQKEINFNKAQTLFEKPQWDGHWFSVVWSANGANLQRTKQVV